MQPLQPPRTLVFENDFKGVFHQIAALVPPGNLLEMQIIGSQPRPMESDDLGIWPNDLCF